MQLHTVWHYKKRNFSVTLGLKNISDFHAVCKLGKGAFFQKVRLIFQISQSPKKIIPKNYPDLNKLFTDMGGNFKF